MPSTSCARRALPASAGFDAGYGKEEPAFLRALEDGGEVFVADVHRTQQVCPEDPGLHVPERPPGWGRRTRKLVAARKPVTLEAFVKGLAPQAWTRCNLRDSTRGPLRVDVAHRRVFVCDGAEAGA
jgi:DDE superfamily endonuclease